MSKSVGHVAELVRHVPARGRILAVIVVSALAWLVAVTALISNLTAFPAPGWRRSLWVAALCGAPPVALWMSRRAVAARRIRGAVPLAVLERRCHGTLRSVADSERRSLRSIAASAHEVAEGTNTLLAELLSIPSVRIFCGVRPAAGSCLPRTPHVVSAGRQLILLESVAWPPGRYETADDRILCDGTYIGQSAGPLLSAVQDWRKALPRNHHVSAMVVVHARSGSAVTLPAPVPGDLAWVQAEDMVGHMRDRLLSGRQSVSRPVMAALLAAIDGRA